MFWESKAWRAVVGKLQGGCRGSLKGVEGGVRQPKCVEGGGRLPKESHASRETGVLARRKRDRKRKEASRRRGGTREPKKRRRSDS